MNGRVYDQKIGRFLQADPIVQAPSFTQSFNRYSYVVNNPLKRVDPSPLSHSGSSVSGQLVSEGWAIGVELVARHAGILRLWILRIPGALFLGGA